MMMGVSIYEIDVALVQLLKPLICPHFHCTGNRFRRGPVQKWGAEIS
jgi:hypothetical protein